MGLFRKDAERVRLFKLADDLISKASALMACPRHEVEFLIEFGDRATIENSINGMTATRAWLMAQVAILDAALALYGVPVEAPTEEPEKTPVMA